jgi:uroporphyrinogen-III decarboxylase
MTTHIKIALLFDYLEKSMATITSKQERLEKFRAFLQNKKTTDHFVILDPSTYAAEFAGKPGGYPTYEDNLAFHKTFENDCPVSAFIFPDAIIPELKWNRSFLKEEAGETYFRETVQIPGVGEKTRITAERPGTQPWIVEAPVKNEADFELIDYYADSVKAGAHLYAKEHREIFKSLKEQGFMPGIVLLTAFEAFYLINYPDMPLFYYDYTERYLKSVRKVNIANLAVADELINVGCEIFLMGSAGLELLSPRIFDEAVIPFIRETTDFIRNRGAFTNYHICGHSYQLLKSGRINAMKPTWFETFSSPPCGNNKDLKESLGYLAADIISKGNLALELLRNGTPRQVKDAVKDIKLATADRRHIIGQADATILSGTPQENIQAFLESASE